MEKRILEVCVDSLESALAAKQGGADRLELCSGLVVGGLTPSPALFDAVREETGLPVNVLIRPRFGDFLYTSGELEIMARDMAYFAQRGASGLVTGALRPDGRLDRGAMGELLAAAGGRPVTLHRAFDVCRDPRETMELAFALGVGTILTSGQQADAWTGRDLIGELLDRAEGRGGHPYRRRRERDRDPGFPPQPAPGPLLPYVRQGGAGQRHDLPQPPGLHGPSRHQRVPGLAHRGGCRP